MSYTTGTATDLVALKAAIVAACAAAGWSSSGSVIYKGGLALRIANKVRGAVTGLEFCGGTGQAAGALVGACPYVCEMATWPAGALAFPVIYRVFAFSNPDEVYVVVNGDVDHFQWAAWGQSAITLPGTGMWFAAPYQASPGSPYCERVTVDMATGVQTWLESCPILLGRTMSSGQAGAVECFLNHGLDGADWTTGTAAAPLVSALPAANPLYSLLPNAWNSETVLLPIQGILARPSGLSSLVLQPRNARYARIDNYAPGEIVSLGADRWMMLPWVRKNASERNGHAARTANIHSGTAGWAIRYEGP